MEFRIAKTFQDALDKLQHKEQKAVKTSAFDMQMNPANPGLQLHRITAAKDDNFWSARVNRDIRIIVHKTAKSFLLAYVDHHDDAYKWAERRRIEQHPKTGAIQIVEVRELVEDLVQFRPQQIELELPEGVSISRPSQEQSQNEPFNSLDEEQLLSIGVPQDWISDVLAASDDSFLDLAEHLPDEASEALLEFVSTGSLSVPEPVVVSDPFEHPDAQRRFRVVENVEEMEVALNAPWEKWIVFLHPSQRKTVEQEFKGPARVIGSAGTGKTVVALHRAVRLAGKNDDTRILLTTFSDPLASALERKLKIMTNDSDLIVPRITVGSFFGIAREMYQLATGRNPMVSPEDVVKSLLKKSASAVKIKASDRFLMSEWRHVVDAWQITSSEEYASVPRIGRKSRLGKKQRDQLWPVFEVVQKQISSRGMMTEAGIFQSVTEHYENETRKPFDHIIVDEAQDLGVPELRFLASLAPQENDALFFAGDLGQRIFQQPFSWKNLGINVQGRSRNLKVNYRTSHQIRKTADQLMPASVSDADGEKGERKGTVSVFNGPDPLIILADTKDNEIKTVADFINNAIAEGIAPAEIGIFTRTRATIDRSLDAVKKAGAKAFELTLHKEGPEGCVRIGTMHLAKGLEFKAVAVMGLDEDQLPLRERIQSAADVIELDDIQSSERSLFYVACTRARDRLLVSGVAPGSEFLRDLQE